MREIITIALPMLVSFACDTVMTFTDRMFLSRLEPELMIAAMAGGLSVFVMMAFVLGLTGYVTALAGQYLGSGQPRRCSVVLTQAVFVIVVSYPLIVLLRPLGHAVFDAVGLAAQQLEPQKRYFDVLLLGTIFSLLRHALSSFFSGIGKTRIVMIAAIVTMTVNIGVNYVLIFGKWGIPAMGITGAAIGTIVGAACGCLVLLVEYLGPRIRETYGVFESLRYDPVVMGKLLRFGYPAGIEFLLNLIAFDALILMFHAVDEITATAATIMFNWDMVSFVPLIGIEIAVTSLVGRYMGAGNPGIAEKAAYSGVKLGLLYSAMVLVLFVGLPHTLADFFQPQDLTDPVFVQARPLAVFMIRIAAFYVLVQAFFVVIIGALRGAGDTHWAMRFSVSVHWIIAGLTGVTLHVFGWTPQAAWVALVLAFISTSFWLYRRFREGRWKSIRIVDGPEPVTQPLGDFVPPPDL